MQFGRPVTDRIEIGGRVGVVIGEGTKADQRGAEVCERHAECRRVADSREGGDPGVRQAFERLRSGRCRPQLHRSVCGLHPDRRQPAPAGCREDAANVSPPLGIDRRRPRQHHGVAAGEAGERLPQQAAGKEMAATIGVGGIDGDDVEVTAETTVLEAVVEQRDLRPRGCRLPDAGDSVAVGHMRHVRQQNGQLGRLVAAFPAGGPVATAHDGRPHAVGRHRPRQPGHQWRLSRAAEREVADRNDRHRPVGGRQQAVIVGRVAAADHQTVGGREPGQGKPCQRRAHAAGRAVHQTLECLGVGEQGHAGFLFRRCCRLTARRGLP